MKGIVKFFFSCFVLGVIAWIPLEAQKIAKGAHIKFPSDLRVGAEQMQLYLPLLKGKSIAIVANQTSMIGKTHLVDTLKSKGVHIQCIFAPEHGFRGEKGNGDSVANGIDLKTGIKIVSLYGKHKKPTQQDLSGVSIVLFDIQDVGARFYTYISTLQYVMEACAEQKKLLILLDRPNPNGFYVDGPVLDTTYRSFVGLKQIPIVHGMTMGEYARMLNGEKWLNQGRQCKLKVIQVRNYSHSDLYQLPVYPSPNLPNMNAVYLYPSVCLFEGTHVSLGRGTNHPFEVIGYPGYAGGTIQFKPVNIPGVATNPPYRDTLCSGLDLQKFTSDSVSTRIELHWLRQFYESYPDKKAFFQAYFENLAGTVTLRNSIVGGDSDSQIRESWQAGIKGFKEKRKKYLLYTDFE